MRPGGRSLAAVLVPLGVSLCSTAAPSEGGQDPGTAGGDRQELTLTIEETVAMGLRNNPRIGLLESEADLRTYRMRSLDWIDNPEIRVRNLVARRRRARIDEYEIGIRWRPPALGEARVRRQRREVTMWERRAEAVRERHWLASRVRRSCADLAMYAELARLAARGIEKESRRISQIETMVDLGRRSIVYLTKARTAVAEARQAHLRSLHALREEERRLRRLTGVSARIQLAAEPLPEIVGNEQQLVALAYANRPELRLAEERHQLAVDRHDFESRRLLPQLSFLEVSRHVEGGEDDWHELAFGVELPLFNRNADNLAGLSLAVSDSELEAAAVRRRIADEVCEGLSDYTEALLARNLTRREGEAVIQAASLVVLRTYDHPTVPADEILELERTIMDAQVAIAEGERDLSHALYFLYYELGIDGPQSLPPLPPRESGHGG